MRWACIVATRNACRLGLTICHGAFKWLRYCKAPKKHISKASEMIHKLVCAYAHACAINGSFPHEVKAASNDGMKRVLLLKTRNSTVSLQSVHRYDQTGQYRDTWIYTHVHEIAAGFSERYSTCRDSTTLQGTELKRVSCFF